MLHNAAAGGRCAQVCGIVAVGTPWYTSEGRPVTYPGVDNIVKMKALLKLYSSNVLTNFPSFSVFLRPS